MKTHITQKIPSNSSAAYNHKVLNVAPVFSFLACVKKHVISILIWSYKIQKRKYKAEKEEDMR
jgi:hypothetical protein